MPTYGNTYHRGYGPEHRALRRYWQPLVADGRVSCARCGRAIHPMQPWDLGHSTDRTAHTGPEHTYCNRSAGARLGNHRRAQRRRARYTSRRW
jgi:hypothetical protein